MQFFKTAILAYFTDDRLMMDDDKFESSPVQVLHHGLHPSKPPEVHSVYHPIPEELWI